jgi:hypothetical protein
MPDDQLYLDPQRAMAAARDLVSAGEHLKSLRDRDGAAIAAASAKPPWGSDEIGSAFEKTYRKLEQQTLSSWEKIAQYVMGLGYAGGKTVNDNLHTDADAATRVRGTWKSA